MNEKKATIIRKIILAISIAMTVFHCYTALTTPRQPMEQRGIHLLFAFLLVFLYASLKQKHVGVRIIYYVCGVAGAAACAYIVMNWVEATGRTTRLLTSDYIMAIITIILVIVATWMNVGMWMPLIALVFILYAYIGPSLPGVLHFKAITLNRFLSNVYFGTEGIYGSCIGVSATFAFMFLLYAEFLVAFGAGDFIIKISEACLGTVKGGPAKIAVIASSLFGMVSGSAVANVAATGSITIPLMKSAGYDSEESGAVVASASTGGQIMPPMMGTAAFIMSEMLSIAYSAICIAALIPAVLYYLALFVIMDLKSKKKGIGGVPRDQLPDPKVVFKDGWHYIISIVVLLVLLIPMSYSPAKSAFWAAITLMAVDWIRKLITKQKIEPKKLLQICEKSCKSALTLATVTACAGIIIGTFVATGLNLRFSAVLVQLSGGNLLLLLILSAIGALVMGMGLPTTPVYILLSVLVVPALTQMGVAPIAAHMFVFYFGVMAPVTPPVGLAFYVASGIAESKPITTGFQAFLMSIGGFLLPFVFVYDSGLLLQGSAGSILWAILYAAVGTIAISIGIAGYLFKDLNVVKRALFIVFAVITIYPEPVSSVIGMIVIAALIVIEIIRGKGSKQETVKATV